MKEKRGLRAMVFAVLAVIAACSTVPGEIREVALDVPFQRLARQTDRYAGRVVILGGYIEQIRTSGDTTRFVVLQAPLGMFDQPKSKDRSEGRFLVIHDGLLGKQGYDIGQDITIVGTVIGGRVPEFEGYTARLPAIRMEEIYRWHYGHEDEYCNTLINGGALPEYEYPSAMDRKLHDRRFPADRPHTSGGDTQNGD